MWKNTSRTVYGVECGNRGARSRVPRILTKDISFRGVGGNGGAGFGIGRIADSVNGGSRWVTLPLWSGIGRSLRQPRRRSPHGSTPRHQDREAKHERGPDGDDGEDTAAIGHQEVVRGSRDIRYRVASSRTPRSAPPPRLMAKRSVAGSVTFNNATFRSIARSRSVPPRGRISGVG